MKNFYNKFSSLFSEHFSQYIVYFLFIFLVLSKIYRHWFLKTDLIDNLAIMLFSLLFTVLFFKKLVFLVEKFRESTPFISMLYFHLYFKEMFFDIIVRFWEFIKKKELYVVFLMIFVIIYWSWNFFFIFYAFILNSNLNNFLVNLIEFSLFLLLLILAVFNFIENRLIFSKKNVEILRKKDLDFSLVKSFLNIKNTGFKKDNIKLYYLQKRHINLNSSEVFKRGLEYFAIIFTSASAATGAQLFLSYKQHIDEKKKIENELNKTRLQALKLLQEERQHKEKMDFQKMESRTTRLRGINAEINKLEKEQLHSNGTINNSIIIENLKRERSQIETSYSIETPPQRVQLHESVSKLIEEMNN
uniref:hypothetical protein n=1 Tax=Paralagenidium karlingii TaxID=1440115 RepID=UPI0026E23777|nr:hypothetical protein Q6B14_mgp16 [Paralagenidium karlingii]WJH17924.1 hypothetical protein [Paralagenidium karlingii]